MREIKKLLYKYPELSVKIWTDSFSENMYHAAISCYIHDHETNPYEEEHLTLTGSGRGILEAIRELHERVLLQLLIDEEENRSTFMGLNYNVIREDIISNPEPDTMDEMYAEDGSFIGLVGSIDQFIKFAVKSEEEFIE